MQALTALLSLASALTSAHGGRCEPVNHRTLECTQPFAANQREERFAVQLPAGSTGKRAVLFLHGAGRDHLTLARDPSAAAALERSSSVLVFPQGRPSWWVDSEGSRYESYALELMDRISAALQIPNDGAHWSAAGWSMGGFGSLRLVVRHPERFGAWGGIISLADFPNPSYPAAENHTVPAFLTATDNPLPLVERLRGKRIWFSTGESAFDRHMNQELDRRLTAAGIGHEFRTLPGGHEFKVVADSLEPLLRFLDAAP